MNRPLSPRDGIGPSSVWLPAGAWPTVLAFLTERFAAVDPAIWIARMKNGEVVDEFGTCLRPDYAYRGGVRIYYFREQEAETPIPFEETVLYRDEHILVADKPHFLPVTPAGRFLKETLLVRLKRKLQLNNLAPIHRIDRETAGLVLFSVRADTRAAYHALFRQHAIQKTYEAMADRLPGMTFPITRCSRLAPGNPFFLMREEAGEPNSETLIELLHNDGNTACYRLQPVTGRKHQLRVHMAALGIPIRNDAFYPHLLPDKGDDFSAPLQLIARTLAFTDPVSGARHRFVSPRTFS